MKYKDFLIDYSERDKVWIISYTPGSNPEMADILGHGYSLNEAQRMVDFYYNVCYVK